MSLSWATSALGWRTLADDYSGVLVERRNPARGTTSPELAPKATSTSTTANGCPTSRIRFGPN